MRALRSSALARSAGVELGDFLGILDLGRFAHCLECRHERPNFDHQVRECKMHSTNLRQVHQARDQLGNDPELNGSYLILLEGAV
jgi:hypothetical protein